MKLAMAAAIGVIALVLACIAFAAPPAPQDNATPDKKAKDVASIDGDKWKWHGDKTTSVYSITGHVVVKHGDTTVTSDKAEYDEKARIVVIEGGVTIIDGQNHITGDKATTFLNERRNLVEGHVRLVGIPKQGEPVNNASTASANLREPTTIVCDKLEYLYRKKIATVEGNLKITQKSRELVGNRAVYDANQELVTLTGGVHITDERGQTFTSPGEVKVSLKEGSEWIEAGSGSATLNVDIDEEKEPAKATEKKQ